MSTQSLELLLNRWRFPADIIDKYKSMGIRDIFNWQYECLNLPHIADDKKNLVYSAPTSAGKTLVAELLMLKNVLDSKRKAIMILPYVSLAKEKLKHLQGLLTDSFLKVDGFIGNTSPGGGFQSVDIAICTIEKANSLINRLIDEEMMSDLSVVVVDELHMVNDTSRGYLLELILSKIKYLTLKGLASFKIQIVGMSATLPNLKDISDWLGATLYQTSYRPIDLVETIKYETDLIDKHGRLVSKIKVDSRIENDSDLLAHLVLETITNKLGVLVFCPTKARCETLAENIARSIFSLDRVHNQNLDFLSKEHLISCLNDLKNTPSGLDPVLNKTVRYGIAFHHAGLTVEERDIVETYFKQGYLLVICCTSTLSSGVNFPARRVIIRTPIFNGRPLDAMSYKQMAGRAGRKGIDTCGESILMCSNANERKIAEQLLNASYSEASSSTTSKPSVDPDILSASIKRALLETIVSGVASNRQEVINYVSCFIASSTQPIDYEKYLKWLNTSQFIDIVRREDSQEECYKPTQLAYAVVSSSMSPDEGLVIFGELQKAMQCCVLENELHIVYQITPINVCDYWVTSSASIDWNFYYTMVQNFKPDVKRVADLVGVRQSFLLKMIKGSSVNASSSSQDQKLFKVHLRFYTALILNDLVSEVPFSKVLSKFGCQKGFLQTLQQSSATYAAMITVFCNRLGWFNLELLVNQFQSRLMFGVQRQLLDLIRISLLSSPHRARLFYNAGFTTIASLATCDLKKIEKILRSGMTFSGKSANSEEANEVAIWHDSKGYTYWQASEAILEEANALLRSDLEQMGVKIEKKPSTEAANKSVNKSIFQFNETIESIIQTPPKQEAPKLTTILEDKMQIDMKEEDEVKVTVRTETPIKQTQNDDEDDDQLLLNMTLDKTKVLAKRLLDKKPTTPSRTPNRQVLSENPINTTIVSEDILEMCDIFEKNVLSNKKTSENQISKMNEDNAACKKMLNFSLGDETLQRIMDSQDEQQSPCDKLRPVLVDLESRFNLQIKLITNMTDLKLLAEQSLKAKSTVSISLTSQRVRSKSEREFVTISDEETADFNICLYGIFLCSDSDRKQAIFIPFLNQFKSYIRMLGKIFEREDLIRIMFYSKQHAKLMFKALSLSMKMPCYDPIMANWLLNHELASIFQIKQKYCTGNIILPIDSALKSKKSCFGCNSEQSDLTTCLYGSLAECLIGINSFEKVKLQLQLQNIWVYYAKIESEIVLLSSQIEHIGFGLDLTELDVIKSCLIKKRKEIEDRVRLIAEREVNLNSPDDVATLLYDKLKLRPLMDQKKRVVGINYDKFKHHSTSKIILQQLASQHECPTLITLWRKINYTLTNSIYPIERAKVYHKRLQMYRIHPSIDLFHVTGRMNFYNPCLQSIPRDFSVDIEGEIAAAAKDTVDLSELDEIDKEQLQGIDANEVSIFFLEKINEKEPTVGCSQNGEQDWISLRNVFISSESNVLLSVDYCQLEFRIITNLCKDTGLIDAFNADTQSDVFNVLASKWLCVPLDQIDEEKRQNVKKIVYGIIYGLGAKTLSLFMNTSENESAQFIDSFKNTFPGLKKFIHSQIENCRLKGYVETIRKRRRYLPDINSTDPKKKAHAERQAINTVIQGSASDLVKSAMVKIEKTLRKKYGSQGKENKDNWPEQFRGAYMVMQLHDELIFEVNKQDLSEVQAIVKECMENCMELTVSMKVKMKVGPRWGSMNSVK